MAEKNQDIKQILSALNSDDLIENLNRLSQILGNPEKGDKAKKMLSTLIKEKNQEFSTFNVKTSHTDPAINLLIALKPFMTENRQNKIDEYLKTLNIGFVLRNLKDLT